MQIRARSCITQVNTSLLIDKFVINIFSSELIWRRAKSTGRPLLCTTRGSRWLTSGEGMLTSPPAAPGVRTRCPPSSPPPRESRLYWQPCLWTGINIICHVIFVNLCQNNLHVICVEPNPQLSFIFPPNNCVKSSKLHVM